MKRLSKLLAVMGIALAGALVPANKPLAADQNLKIDSKAFPDEAFREVVAFYDKNGDGYLSPGEREDVTAIASNYRAITSLKGIEYFTELTNINLGYSAKIEYIDLTKNTKLAYLTFDYYGKESIDLSRNTQLEYLSISWKNAPETGKWDLSANKELEDVSLYTNIGSIDLTNNTKLTHLVLQAPLEKLDLRKNTQLAYLHVDSYNKLRAIDLTKHKKLAYLTIHSDELESLNLDNNTNLVSLYLYTAKLKKLSLDKNLKLNDVWIDHNEYLEALDFSKQTKLTHLILQSTKIKDLKLNSDVLSDVHLYLNSGLKYLDLSHCAMLRDVYNSGKKEVTFIGVEYTKGDIDLYLNKEDKVVNNIVISTAIIDADRGDEIKLGKSITGGSVTGAGVYNTGDKVAIKVNPDTKNAYNVEAIYSGEKTNGKIVKKKALTKSGTYQFDAKEDAIFVVVIKNHAPYKMAFSDDSKYIYGGKVKVVLSKMEGYGTYPSVTYQWYRGDKKIEGATKPVYTAQKEDVGKKLSCEMITADGGKKKISAENVIGKGAGKSIEVQLKAKAPSREGGDDGQIVGVTTSMEYATNKNFTNKKTCPKSKLTVKAGTYYIRYAETDYSFAGKYIVVKVPDGPSATEVFKDLETDAWYIDAVKYVYSHGIMNGVSDKSFEPMGQTTRAQFVTMLYNLAGKPKVTSKAGFKDVKKGAWYEKAVNWAYGAKITSGLSKTKFGTEDKITRQQAATMLYNYAVYKKMNTSTDKKALDNFPDKNKVANWALDAFRWAVHYGVISGKPQGKKLYLAPDAMITRAECAQMIMNMMKKVK